MLFQTGTIVVTQGIDTLMKTSDEFAARVMASLERHVAGDWGEIHPGDQGLNEEAVKNGDRILSVYKIDPTIWIITESDRSATTVLLPEEY